jgi:hypothetical protein
MSENPVHKAILQGQEADAFKDVNDGFAEAAAIWQQMLDRSGATRERRMLELEGASTDRVHRVRTRARSASRTPKARRWEVVPGLPHPPI